MSRQLALFVANAAKILAPSALSECPRDSSTNPDPMLHPDLSQRQLIEALLMSCGSSAMGKSRSATIVIAYMMRQLRSTSPQEALERLRTVRPMVEPNPGFMSQLELYHRMGCPEDGSTHPQYQRWLYECEVEASLACGRPPAAIRFEDEVDAQTGSSAVTTIDTRCRRCRRSLAASQHRVAHEPKQSSGVRSAKAVSSHPNTTEGAAAQTPNDCAHVFVEPLSWMRPELKQGKLEGKLECPTERCRSVVGKYAWQGMRCSCGGWIVPAFSLAKDKIDQIGTSKTPAVSGKI